MKKCLMMAAAAAACLIGSVANAANLEIQFEGMNLVYDGSTIYDAASIAGGGGIPALADPLTNVTFLVDGSIVGTLSTDIWLDVFISGVTGLPVGGGQIVTSGQGDTFGFDLLTKDMTPGWGLALNLDEVIVSYTGMKIAIAGGAAAASVPVPQMLPFGLEFHEMETITIAFSSANLSSVTDDGMFLTGFSASGTGNISGTLVPEPSAVVLLMLGMVGLLVNRYRRS